MGGWAGTKNPANYSIRLRDVWSRRYGEPGIGARWETSTRDSAEISEEFSLEYGNSICPYSHQQVFVPAADVKYTPVCLKATRGNLFESAVEINVVENFFVNDAIAGEVFGAEPVRDFGIGLGDRAGCMNEIAHRARVGIGHRV